MPFSPVYRGRDAGGDVDVVTLLRHIPDVGFPAPINDASTVTWHIPYLSIASTPPSIGRPVSPVQSVFAPSTGGLGTGGPGIGGGSVSGAGNGFGPHRVVFKSLEVIADAQPLSPMLGFRCVHR
jgi:hypothetical protein